MAKASKVKGIKKHDPLLDNAARIIATRLDDMYQFAPYVEDPANIDAIHDLRIAAKRLRYTLEMFRFAYPPEIKELISEVKKIQSTIGDMRDADIMVDTVLTLLDDRADSRRDRLRDIATSSDRGTIAQRKQRIGEAISAKTVQRDDIAYYTLVAHKADTSTESYETFRMHWAKMQETDFFGRLRLFAGIDTPEPSEGEAVETDEFVAEDHLIPDRSIELIVEEPGE